MKFQIQKNIFLRYLSITAKAISNFSPLPAFSGIKFEVRDDTITLIASDSDISIKTIIKSDEKNQLIIERGGGAVIEARYILEILRKINGEIVQMELIPDTMICTIISPNNNFRLNVIKESDYPPLDFSQPNQSFKIDSTLLKEISSKVAYAVSDNETKPVLTGIHFECQNNILSCVATDIYRLAKKDFNVDAFNFKFTLPSKTLKEISSIVEDDTKLNVFVSDKKVQFQINEFLIQSRLIDGIYPDYQRVIPTSYKYELKMNLIDLKNAISRASLLKTDGISLLKLFLSTDLIELSAKSIEIGSFEERLFGEYTGNELSISFNGKYLDDSLKALGDEETIFMRFNSENQAFLLQGNDSSLIQLNIPIKTHS